MYVIKLYPLFACNLANVGTPEERGLIAWAKEMNLTSEPTTGEETSTYDFPIGMNLLRKLVFDCTTYYIEHA